MAGRRRRRPLQDKSRSTANSQNKKYTFYSISAQTQFTPACPVSATPTAFASRIGQFPPLYAGVQAMRARICSALSCAMFARVVWLKSWRAQNCRFLLCPRAARTRHAWLARLTRARGKRFQREWNALFDDFWYFWSYKSTIKEKLLYDSSRANNVAPTV